jgi:holo-ACP synthase
LLSTVTDQLSMSSAKSGSEILAARDRRQEQLEERFSEGCLVTVTVSLNIPGPEKNPPGVSELFSWALSRLFDEFPDSANLLQSEDQLGPFAVISLDREARGVKRACIAMEDAEPFARLVDFDVYDGCGSQVDRAALGVLPRSCLVCDQAAVDCIRLGRHKAEDLLERSYELLALCRH